MSRPAVRLLLLLVVVLIPMLSLEAASWVPGLRRATLLALAGLATGVALYHWRPRDWRLYQPLGLLLGFVVTPFAFADMAASGTFNERMEAMLERLWQWGVTAVQGGVGTDVLILALALGLMGWTLGLVGATSVLGAHSGWWPVLPGVTVLLVNISVGPPGLLSYLVVYLPAAIALVGLAQLDGWHADWRREGLLVEPSVLGRATHWTLVLSVLLVGLAWALPASSHGPTLEELRQQLTRPIEGTLRRAQLSIDRLFPSVHGSEVIAGPVVFADRMEPQASVNLGDRVVLEVESPQAGYWRAATYDRYTGSAMISSRTVGEVLPADEPWPEADFDDDRHVVEQQVTLLAAQSSVVLAMESPYQVSLVSEWWHRDEPRDLQAIHFRNALRRGETYTVRSSVLEVSAGRLRDASDSYPEWVERYLQLPSKLPGRLYEEADQVTAPADNNFDRAAAIEAYLRRMEYSTEVSIPPPGQDWVEYLLFETQTGYCDFFATAMVVMLRTQGIPARVASGYATGERDGARNVYVVREKQAHSWVEAYFPSYGWVTFEPSAIQGLPDRGSDPIELEFDDEDFAGDDEFDEFDEFWDDELWMDYDAGSTTGGSILRAFVMALGLVAIGGLGGLLFVWQRDLQRLEWYERPYAELRRLTRWLVGPAPSGLTPLEFGEWLGTHFPGLQPQVDEVVRAYALARYGGRRAQEELLRPARRTRLRLFLGLLRHQVRRLDDALGQRLG